MKITLTVFIFLLILLTSCRNKEQSWSELPEVTDIRTLKATEFVPTLESPISKDKNAVYAAALLYAWDKVQLKLEGPVKLSGSNSAEFRTLNQSSSFRNTLAEGEYAAEAEVTDGVIMARAFFNKTLPFPAKLEKLDSPIVFSNTEVAAFGMHSYDAGFLNFVQIVHYQDDDNFILKLMPRDDQHEILLVKGISKAEHIAAAFQQTNELMELGKKESINEKTGWKYILNETDIFSIPEIKFNVEANYPKLEGQVFTAKGNRHHVETAYQRTGFILNENGAVVESEAVTTLDTGSAEPVKIYPKKMVFDKPFFVFIKRTNSANPYFAMFVQNAELLRRE